MSFQKRKKQVRKKRQDIKIVGVITEIESKKIHINLNFPYPNLNYKYRDIPNKLVELDKKIKKELLGIQYDEETENIKFFKPYYFKFHRSNLPTSNKTTRDMFVKLNAPKRYLPCDSDAEMKMLGSIVEIIATPRTYNFSNPEDGKQKIRGWSMNIKYMKPLSTKQTEF